VDAALRKARELELRTLTITVLDPGGHVLAVKREGGGGILRRRSRMRRHGDASGPARAVPPAHGMRPVTRHFLAALAAISEGRIASSRRGLLIRDMQGDLPARSGSAATAPRTTKRAPLRESAVS
jgi:hypothetical protein